jgi:hypothetical protein
MYNKTNIKKKEEEREARFLLKVPALKTALLTRGDNRDVICTKIKFHKKSVCNLS